MTDWLRPLAPLGYMVGAILLIDQVAFLVSQGPYTLGADGDRIRFAMLVASRLSALGIGLLLLGGSAVLSGHRRVRVWLGMLTALAVVAAITVVALAAASSPEPFLQDAARTNPDYVFAARAMRLRVIITGLAGSVALAGLAVVVVRHFPAAASSEA